MHHWLLAHGYCGRHTAAHLVEHLQSAAAGHHGESTADTDAASELIVLTLVDILDELRTKTAALEERIKEALLAHPDGPIFTSLPRA